MINLCRSYRVQVPELHCLNIYLLHEVRRIKKKVRHCIISEGLGNLRKNELWHEYHDILCRGNHKSLIKVERGAQLPLPYSSYIIQPNQPSYL